MHDRDYYYYDDGDIGNGAARVVNTILKDPISTAKVKAVSDGQQRSVKQAFSVKSTLHRQLEKSSKHCELHTNLHHRRFQSNGPEISDLHQIMDVVSMEPSPKTAYPASVGASLTGSAKLPGCNNYTTISDNGDPRETRTTTFEHSVPSQVSDPRHGNGTYLWRSHFLPGLFRENFHDISTPYNPVGIQDLNITGASINSSNCLGLAGNETSNYGNIHVEGDYFYDYGNEDLPLPLDEIVPVSLVYGSTLVVGVVGNLLVIAAVARDRRLRSITNLFLTSLACADLALLCFCVPVKCVAFFSFSWAFGFFLCKSVHYIQIVAMVCSVMTLTVMSIERNIAILSPLRSKRICTRGRARIVVGLLWAGSIVLALPILAGQKHKLVGERHKAYWCTKEWDVPIYGILFESYMLVLLFLVPVGVMVISYTTICLELSRGTKFRRQATYTQSNIGYRGCASYRSRPGSKRKEMSGGGGCMENILHSSQKERIDKEKLKVVRMLIVVVVLFAVCWGPILINNLLVALNVLDKLHIGHLKPLRQALFILSYLNSSLNPLVYGFMSRHFRHGFRDAICVCFSGTARRGGDNRLNRGRRNNNMNCHYVSEGGTSTINTGTIRLSPVTEQVRAAVENESEQSPMVCKKSSRKIWARTDRVTLGLHDT